jgi:hypothetical protein
MSQLPSGFDIASAIMSTRSERYNKTLRAAVQADQAKGVEEAQMHYSNVHKGTTYSAFPSGVGVDNSTREIHNSEIRTLND